MSAAALPSRQGGANNRFGGGEHRPQLKSVLQVDIEALRAADAKTRKIALLHFLDASERSCQLACGTERPRLFPHDSLQLGLQLDGSRAIRRGVSPELIQLL